MKILLFNLGPVAHRIIDWDIDGFKSLFEQDIILWGPIPDEKFKYQNKEIPILSFFEPLSIKAVFDKLPKNWYPDVVTCDTSVLNYIPDIYLCPVKTVLFSRDAWSDTIFNRGLVESFDFLNHATIDRSLYNAFHVNLMPLSNSAVSIPPVGTVCPGFEDRDIDVAAIANYNNGFYHERFKTFYKISQSNRSGLNIKFLTNIPRAELYSYYQRSKIMIDWAHTLSNRSYEAALNGCLLFSHKDNTLIREFWTPWEEYVPYDENDMSELLNFYVNNPDLSKKIISKAREKINRTPASWGDYVWNNIEIAFNTDVSIENRISYNNSLHSAIRHYRSATPLTYNYDYNTSFPADWKELYFERIDKAISASEDKELKTATLIEAARMAFLLKKHDLAISYLTELQKVIPEYAWTYYLLGRISYDRKEDKQAIEWLGKSIDSALKNPEPLQQFVLPVIEKGNSCDGRRITDFMWKNTHNHNNEFQVAALLYMANELLGNLYLQSGENEKAKNAYSEAINAVPLADCIYKIGPLLIEAAEFQKLLQITDMGITDSPYDSSLILYKAIALVRLNRKKDASFILNEHKKALVSFTGVRKFKVLGYLINIISVLVLLSRQLSSKMITGVIRILNKKLGFNYLN